jgi:L-amino acid N-acyltransferase YncA
MFHFEICVNNILIRNLKADELNKVLEWYNNTDEYKYATGIEESVSIDFVKGKYIEAAICRNEFFAGIFIDDFILIGVIKGNIRHGNYGILWINSFIIDTNYRNKGIGSKSLSILFNYFKTKKMIETVFISVFEVNDVGMAFWKKHNFNEITNISKKQKNSSLSGNTIIMSKKL